MIADEEPSQTLSREAVPIKLKVSSSFELYMRLKIQSIFTDS
jgi:hypothetical protein